MNQRRGITGRSNRCRETTARQEAQHGFMEDFALHIFVPSEQERPPLLRNPDRSPFGINR
jgi:hypothetical protein